MRQWRDLPYEQPGDPFYSILLLHWDDVIDMEHEACSGSFLLPSGMREPRRSGSTPMKSASACRPTPRYPTSPCRHQRHRRQGLPRHRQRRRTAATATGVSRSGRECRRSLRPPSAAARSNPTTLGDGGGTEMFLKAGAAAGETRSLSDGDVDETSSSRAGDHRRRD